MDPGVGRFVSADTLSDLAFESRVLHRYLYAANHPQDVTDPTGQLEGIQSFLVSAAIQGIISGIIDGVVTYVFSRNVEEALINAAEGFFLGAALGFWGKWAARAGRVLTTAEKGVVGQRAVVRLLKGRGEKILEENLWYYVGGAARRIRGEVDILGEKALYEVKNYTWHKYDDYLLTKLEQRFARQIASRRAFLRGVAGAKGFEVSREIVFFLSEGAPARIVNFLRREGVVVEFFVP